MESKQEIRKCCLQTRKTLTLKEQEDKSQIIQQKLLESVEIQKADIIFLYVDKEPEVKTRMLIELMLSMGKKVGVPKVQQKQMEFYTVHSLSELAPGVMGILEPSPLPENLLTTADCIVMPGVAFDEERNRIGYGGGYYDKYLSRYQVGAKLAIAYECQIINQIPAEKTDIKPDRIITEDRVIHK